jgi:DNA-binding transcriptional regulator YbjK
MEPAHLFPTDGGPPALDRRGVILDAALAVIAAGGVDAVTHRRVAAAAAVPLGSTTYYFSSREALLREAFRHYAARALAWLKALESERPPRSAADLVEFLVEIARREFADPTAVLVEYELILRAAREPSLAREFQTFEHTLAARLAEMLEQLGAEQPFDAARTLTALMRGFELERLTRPGAPVEDLRHRLDPVVAALITRRSHGHPAPARPHERRGSRRRPRP